MSNNHAVLVDLDVPKKRSYFFDFNIVQENYLRKFVSECICYKYLDIIIFSKKYKLLTVDRTHFLYISLKTAL